MKSHKYNPQDYPYPVNEDMEKVYNAYDNNSKVDLFTKTFRHVSYYFRRKNA